MIRALLVIAVAATVATTAEHAETPQAAASERCGVELWPLKTLSDRQRRVVRLRAVNTSIAGIVKLRRPRPVPTTRSTPYQRRVWRVTAQITVYKLEEDSEIHLVLFWRGNYMVAEMPSPTCLPRTTRARRTIISARRRFESACGAATDSWRSLGAVVRISGVGFWDRLHGQRGIPRNSAELHRVTGIQFVSGCGA